MKLESDRTISLSPTLDGHVYEKGKCPGPWEPFISQLSGLLFFVEEFWKLGIELFNIMEAIVGHYTVERVKFKSCRPTRWLLPT